MTTTTPELLTERQAAQLLGVGHCTLRDWRRAGTGPAHIRLTTARNGLVRYRPEDLNTWINEHVEGQKR